MSDKITEQEKQAIRSYVTGGGIVHRCPDGEAIGAHICWNGDYFDWLSSQGILVSPAQQKVASNVVSLFDRPLTRSVAETAERDADIVDTVANGASYEEAGEPYGLNKHAVYNIVWKAKNVKKAA